MRALGHLRRAVAVPAAALLACLAGTGTAAAHEVDADVRFVVESVEPQVEGLTVVVVRGIAPQVVVENRTGGVLEALDGDGRAFLRVGPAGVEADRAAFAWIDTADPSGIPPGVEVARDLRPDWATVREEPSWGWFDHRLHEEALTFDEPADGPVVVDRWQLDFRYEGQPLTVFGRTERRPLQGLTVAVLTGGNQPLPSVTAQVLPGQLPGVLVTASSPVTVLGQDGEPFLRFGPAGVEANRRSPTWLLSGRATDEGLDPAGLDLDATAEPAWIVVSDGASLGWLDPRLAAPDELPAGTQVPEVGFVTLATWQLPLVDADGTRTVLTGETRYVPLPDVVAERSWSASLAAVGLAAVLAVVGLVFRRRAR